MLLLGLILFAGLDVLVGVHLYDASSKLMATSLTPLVSDNMTADDCPAMCKCNYDNRNISCSGNIKDFRFSNISYFWKLKSLTLYGGLSQVPEEIKNFTELVSLNLSNNKIKSISKTSFEKNSQITFLDLSQNEISDIDVTAFDNLKNLTFLSLRGNRIKKLPENLFSQSHLLEVLHLNHNLITQIPDRIFLNLLNLKELDLSFNKLGHLQELLFSNLSSLRKLYLSHNRISTVSTELFEKFKDLSTLDLSRNLWDCSCALYPLFRFQKNSTVLLEKVEEYYCARPSTYSSLNVFSLLKETLPCSIPAISHVSNTMDVLYLTEAHITCTANGSPEPFIYWLTPWGHVFAQENQYHLLKGKNVTLKSHSSYYGLPFTTTHIYISSQNSLFITNFRGYFAGKYVCIGVNEMGETNSTVNVQIKSKIQDVYLTSNFVGAGSAGGFLAIGIFAGLMKMCAKAVCKCKCDEDEEAVDKIDDKDSVENSDSPTSTLKSESDYYDYDDDFTPTTPLNSPFARTPRASPRKCQTPTESPDKWRNTAILDTLDEVKFRLEKRIDKVRGHVKAMRSSGSQYIQTIKETGSSAYGRVRTGMIIGVEQVKYGYQSIREFCGTGEMGNQTISMISVSTDVDTNEKSTVVRSVTRV